MKRATLGLNANGYTVTLSDTGATHPLPFTAQAREGEVVAHVSRIYTPRGYRVWALPMVCA